MIGAALACFAVAALVSWVDGCRRDHERPRRGTTGLAWVANLAGAIVLVVAGGAALAGSHPLLSLGELGGLGPGALRVDALSGLFLVIAFGAAIPVLCAAAAPAHRRRPRLAAAVALTLGAVVVIITADNLFVLLFGWETLTVAFYLLAGFDRRGRGRAYASVVTIGFGKLSGAALLLGGLLLVAQTHTFALVALTVDTRSAVGQGAYALLVLGFAIKVGVVPAHVWLPLGYVSAPGPARAVMAGVAVNVGFYGMWRTLQILGAPPEWLTCVVLVAGGFTAILGIAHAAVHPDLASVIAWSSVENAGIITVGYGTALVGATAGNPALTAAGLVAGSAQVIAHALGKSLLFVSVSAIERATGTTNLDELGGVARRLPWAGAGLVIGSLTLAGLPLTVGFASEWFTLESLMQQFRISSLPMQLSTAAAGALVALTVGVGGVTFVRIIALTALGPARMDGPAFDASRAKVDRQWPFRAGVGLLVLACLGLAAIAPLEVRTIATGLTPVVSGAAYGALKGPWVLQPVFAEFSALSPTWLWIVLPALVALLGGVALVFSGRRLIRVRRVAPWSSASPGVDRGVGYTSFGYASPMRKILSTVLLTRTELRGASSAPSTQTRGKPELEYRVEVVEIVNRFFYQPLTVALLVVVRAAKRLQSGRLDMYMAYMLLALLAVLAVVIATS